MAVLSRIRMPAKLESLGGFIGALSGCAKAQGLEPAKISKIELAAEEALVNIFHYAYPGATGDVEMICKEERGRFTVEIIDSGIPFDVTAMPEPRVEGDLHERKPGGLGIFFIKKVMDDVRYRREKDRNILTLIIQKV